MLLKPLFKSNTERKEQELAEVVYIPTTELRDYYSGRYIEDNFGVPGDQMDEFVTYVEGHGLDYSLLKKGKEMEFLEFLTQKSEEFLNAQSGKN